MKKLIGKIVLIRILGRVNRKDRTPFDIVYKAKLKSVENTMIYIEDTVIESHLFPNEVLKEGESFWLNTASLDFVCLQEVK